MKIQRIQRRGNTINRFKRKTSRIFLLILHLFFNHLFHNEILIELDRTQDYRLKHSPNESKNGSTNNLKTNSSIQIPRSKQTIEATRWKIEKRVETFEKKRRTCDPMIKHSNGLIRSISKEFVKIETNKVDVYKDLE